MTRKYLQFNAGWFKPNRKTSSLVVDITRARALFAGTIAAPIYAAFSFVNGFVYNASSLAIICALSSIMSLCAIYVSKVSAHHSLAGHFFTSALAIQVFGEMAVNGGLQAPAAALSLLIVPAAIFSAGPSSIKIWAFVTVAGLVALTSLDSIGYLPANQLSLTAQQSDRVLSLVAGIIVSAVMIIQFDRQASISIHKLLSERASFKHKALHDSLTGMPNRSYFYEHAVKELESSDKGKDTRLIFYFDIDGFKQVNDHHGHAIGDELLIAFSMRLTEILREDDFASRLAGDEFAMITGTAEDALSQKELVQHIRAITQEPFKLTGCTVSVGLSIGCVQAPEDGVTIDTLLNIADSRMYEDKSERRAAAIGASSDKVIPIVPPKAA